MSTPVFWVGMDAGIVFYVLHVGELGKELYIHI